VSKSTYWKPEPKLLDGMFAALLAPALLWVVGVSLYGLEAISAQAPSLGTQLVGSALMVVGGEMGTIATVMEVWRKWKIGEAHLWDWLGIAVSLLATLGNMFVVFSRQTELALAWVTWARSYGPLALLLCSSLDFYANAMELGLRQASFGERWRKWNESRHGWEQRQREGSVKPRPPKEASIGDWRDIAAGLDGERATLTVTGVNELLASHGFVPKAESTARYWVKVAKEET